MSVSILLLSFFLPSPAFSSPPSSQSFASYVREYSEPQFFSSNDSSFNARLKLLDMAPKGAHARVATFIFENSATVRRLSRHLCLAALRGVNVELLIDSKSGARPGFNDSFDKGDNTQVIEDLLQYLANCKVAVHVHNQQSSYVEIMGNRLPNFFPGDEMDGRKLGLFHLPLVLSRFNFLMNRASAIVEQEFSKAGVDTDTGPLFKNLRSLGLKILQSLGEQGPSSGSSLKYSWERILLDPIWDQVSASKVRQVLPKIEARFKRDQEFGPLGEKIRRYNRLNHRKLFLVENGGEGCLILGGRNLGDHYLADSDSSFLDGDLLVCRHQGSEISSSIDASVGSFESLLNDNSDPWLRSGSDNKVIRVPSNYSYEYRNLLFPEGLLPWNARLGSYKGKLSEEERTLLSEKKWRNGLAVAGELSLPFTSRWHLLLSGWDPSRDEVRNEFLRLIGNESRQIYIETAYAEFDSGVREALESALKRGVKVQLITNSFFTSDGPSGLIRILMSNWNEKMVATYPRLFDIRYTALSGGHMTHFKFAAFGCQDEKDRAYLLGSHNFHPRSGNADKEHMLAWNEPTDCKTDLASVSLVKARHAFYNELSRTTRKRVLDRYPDLLRELTIVGKLVRPGKEKKSAFADSLLEMFYEESAPGVWKPRLGARAKKIFRLLDSSGLHDLVGRIF